jgi:hypothetical protein
MEDPTPKKARAKRANPRPAPTARTSSRSQEVDETQPRKAPAKAAKKAPARKAASRQAQPILDEALLAHLDQVLADLDPPALVSPPLPAPPPQAPPRPGPAARPKPAAKRKPTAKTQPVAKTEPAAKTRAKVEPAAPNGPVAPPGDQRTAPLWARLVADPGFAPEHVIRESVRLAGPQAQDWVDRMHVRYPDARPDALARLAATELTREARRRGAGNAAAGRAGAIASVGAVVSVGAVARVQVRLALTVAAVYGLDPTSEARTREVADLLRVPRLTQPTAAAVGNIGRLAAGVAVRRVASRLLPFGAAVAGAVHGGRSTEDLATRAISRFRPGTHKRELEKPDPVA